MKAINGLIALTISVSLLTVGCGGDKKSAGSGSSGIVNKVVDTVTNVAMPYDYEALKKAVYSTNQEERLKVAKKVDKQVSDRMTEIVMKNKDADWKKKSLPETVKVLLNMSTLEAVKKVTKSMLDNMPPTYTKILLRDADYVIDSNKGLTKTNIPLYEAKGYYDCQLSYNYKDPNFNQSDESAVIAFLKKYFWDIIEGNRFQHLDGMKYSYYAPHLHDKLGQNGDFDHTKFKNSPNEPSSRYGLNYGNQPRAYVFNVNVNNTTAIVDFFVMFTGRKGTLAYIGNMELAVINNKLLINGINVREDSLKENPQFVFKIKKSGSNDTSNNAATAAKKNENTATNASGNSADNQQGAITELTILPAFHQAITSKQYRTAYNYLGPEMQNYIGGYDKFVNGYTTTISSKVRDMNVVSSDSNRVVIEYILEAKDRINGEIVEQRFKGKATMKKINGSWRIVDNTAKRISYNSAGTGNSTGKGTGVITATEVRMRQYNNINSEIIGYFNKGERVTILDSNSGWYKVRRSDNSIGWVSGDFCKQQ